MEKTSLKLIYIMALFIVVIDILCIKVEGDPLVCYTDEDCAYVQFQTLEDYAFLSFNFSTGLGVGSLCSATPLVKSFLKTT
ncbi:hypothetical protein RDI58_002048 [Solanum bulbocastanum]|uniref:Uncharacterized protein n=1 Tax=Solanum bulbocastanum TaxID=147425 RepID=A0AAN8U651_SOLBU